MSDCEEHDFHQSAQDCPWCMREELESLRADLKDSSAEIVLNHEEIESFRDELADATKWNHSVNVCKKHVADIIEPGGCVVCELDEANDRIEELEKMCAQFRYEIGGDVCGYIITTEQIDAAVEFALSTGRGSPEWACVWAALRRLNVVECKECGGSGKKKTTVDHNMYGKPVVANLDCPTCHGHGWRIKEVSDE